MCSFWAIHKYATNDTESSLFIDIVKCIITLYIYIYIYIYIYTGLNRNNIRVGGCYIFSFVKSKNQINLRIKFNLRYFSVNITSFFFFFFAFFMSLIFSALKIGRWSSKRPIYVFRQYHRWLCRIQSRNDWWCVYGGEWFAREKRYYACWGNRLHVSTSTWCHQELQDPASARRNPQTENRYSFGWVNIWIWFTQAIQEHKLLSSTATHTHTHGLTHTRTNVYSASQFRIRCLYHLGGARGVMVLVVGNGHGNTSSNPGRDWLHCT